MASLPQNVLEAIFKEAGVSSTALPILSKSVNANISKETVKPYVLAKKVMVAAEKLIPSLPTQEERDGMLHTVVKHKALVDPKDALRLARSIGDEFLRMDALRSVAKAMIGKDKERAFPVLQELLNIEELPRSFKDIYENIKLLIPHDPGGALKLTETILESLYEQRHKDLVLNELVGSFTLHDQLIGEKLAESIADGGKRVEAYTAMAKELASSKPQEALKLMKKAEAIALSQESVSRRIDMQCKIAMAYSSISPSRASALLEKLLPSLQHQGERLYVQLISKKCMSASNPDRQKELFAGAEKEVLGADVGPGQKNNMLALIVGVIAKTEPERSLAVIDNLLPDANLNESLAYVLSQVATHHPEPALSKMKEYLTQEGVADQVKAYLLAELSKSVSSKSGKERQIVLDKIQEFALGLGLNQESLNKFLSTHSVALAGFDPLKARDLALSIVGDELKKVEALSHIAKETSVISPQRASQMFEEAYNAATSFEARASKSRAFQMIIDDIDPL